MRSVVARIQIVGSPKYPGSVGTSVLKAAHEQSTMSCGILSETPNARSTTESITTSRAHAGFSDSWRDSKSREQCEPSVPFGMEGHHGASLQPGLRNRVIDSALGGMPARRAAAQFEIGVATAIVWVRRARASGERTARRQGQPRRSKLDPQRDFLLALVEQTPDMTIIEMQRLGMKGSVGTIWTFLDRCGLTFKNVWSAPGRQARSA